MRRGSVGALAVLGLLCAGGSALADPPADQGEQLVEGSNDWGKTQRLACGSKFCVWHVSHYMGGCSGDDCNSHDLVVSDLKGRALGGSTPFNSGAVARFLGPRQLELVFPVPLIVANPGAESWDTGIPSALYQRQVMTVAPDGKEFDSKPEAEWVSPERHQKLRKLLYPSSAAEKPGLKASVSPAVRAKAQKACGVQDPLEPTHFECRKETGRCLLVLGGKTEEREQPLCVAEVKGKEVRAVPIRKLVPEADEFSLSGSRFCFVWSTGGIRGQAGDEQCISREQLDRMAFVETKGVHLESGDGYPVRSAGSVEEGLALAPTVHASTAAQVSWGRDAWKDEKDLSLTWQAARAAGALHFHIEVADDVLVPLGEGPAVHSDHLELDFWQSRQDSFAKTGPHLKLGVLLAGEGKAQLRLWKRSKGGKEQDVDEAYPATGTWTRTERGYAVDFSLPVEPLRKELAASRPWGLWLMASDADAQGRQKVLMGTRGALPMWDEYPPTLEEYARAYPRD
jgi:hypothetical protein